MDYDRHEAGTDAGAESSRTWAEKEPEGLVAGLCTRVTELWRKGRLGSRWKVLEELLG